MDKLSMSNSIPRCEAIAALSFGCDFTATSGTLVDIVAQDSFIDSAQDDLPAAGHDVGARIPEPVFQEFFGSELGTRAHAGDALPLVLVPGLVDGAGSFHDLLFGATRQFPPFGFGAILHIRIKSPSLRDA
jgi:hypothetical protein